MSKETGAQGSRALYLILKMNTIVITKSWFFLIFFFLSTKTYKVFQVVCLKIVNLTFTVKYIQINTVQIKQLRVFIYYYFMYLLMTI